MLKTPLFSIVFFLALIIAILHIVALEMNLYWLFSWFDILMHFLGGAWVALFLSWTIFFSSFIKVKVKNPFVIIVSATIVMGVLWEVFEVIIDPLFFHDKYVFDTMIDLLMDTFGAICSCVLVNIKLRNGK